MTEDPAVRAARELVVVVSRLRRRLRDASDDEGLTPSQTAVVSDLDREGPASTSELAALEHVRPQSMAATVAVLLELGLVRKDPDPQDGRRHVLSLTDAGHEQLADRRRTKEDWLVTRLREQLGDQELRAVGDALALVERAVR